MRNESFEPVVIGQFGNLHLMPKPKPRPHTVSTRCWCKPKKEPAPKGSVGIKATWRHR